MLTLHFFDRPPFEQWQYNNGVEWMPDGSGRDLYHDIRSKVRAMMPGDRTRVIVQYNEIELDRIIARDALITMLCCMVTAG